MKKVPKKLRKFDQALTAVVLDKPELKTVGIAMMDAACRAYGIDPEAEKRKANREPEESLLRTSDFY